MVHDDHRHRNQRFNESENDIVNELTITPNRMLFEESEPSLNVSANPPRLSRDGTATHTHKDVSRLTHETQDLYEDSKMQSMQTLEERPFPSASINSLN